MSTFNLAQFNIAKGKASLDSPIMKEFVDFLEPVNKLSEEIPGFVWRLKDDEGESSSYVPSPYNNELIIINMSVWKDIESLKYFTYNTVHNYFLKSRKNWFNKIEMPSYVLWWIEEGKIPAIEEGVKKLDLLNKNGSTKDAFSFKDPYTWDGRILKK